MSFTEKELQMVFKVQTLASNRKKIQKRVNAKSVSLANHNTKAALTASALEKERRLLADVDMALNKLKEDLTLSFVQTAPAKNERTGKAIPVSHYEIGRES